MNRRTRSALAAALVVLLLLAQDRTHRAWSETPQDIRLQASIALGESEAHHQRVWRQVLEATRGKQRAAVVAAEEAWRAYRDASAHAASLAAPDPAARTLVWNDTAARMTRARTAELQALLSVLHDR